jgi:transcriptional regulator with XRE-family HTH domain
LKSIYAEDYQRLLNLLVQARKQANLTQQKLAEALGRPQSFVSKFESGERRIDIVEFLTISRVIGVDPHALIRQVEARPSQRQSGR